MELNRLLIKGGILSPSELKQIIDLVENAGLDYFHFGSRQDILFPKTEKLEEVAEQFPQFDIEELSQKRYHNIMCSYVATDIFASTPWLTSTTYLYILEQFQQKTCLEINITDPQQRLVPLFTGNLNFIASKHTDYWYLYLDLPDYEKAEFYPALIHTWDIATIATAVEEYLEEAENVPMLFEFISQNTDTNNRTISEGLSIPFYPFPYYEGMNRMGIDQYWLGLYWRNNRYDLDFLRAMCDLCLECRIGKICITPWKSFIVKGIPRQHKIMWEKFLGSHGINVRHSSLELNWHLPVNDEDALNLKRYLVQNFDQNDISTYGLTFAVSSAYSKKFTSIVIEKNAPLNINPKFAIRPTYNVCYSQNFDPNSRIYKTYAQDVDQVELPGLLMELSHLYFEQLNEETTTFQSDFEQKKEEKQQLPTEKAHQCSNCFTIYDPAYGDEKAGIEKGTLFEDLPADYVCPTCEAEKDAFKLLHNAATVVG
ncbi:MAG: rubredoxin [Bacteroidota bacterium]